MGTEEVLVLTLPFPFVELGLGKGRAVVGLTAANANADVVTWLMLTVGVAFAEIVGKRPRLVPLGSAWDNGNRFRCESNPIRIFELHLGSSQRRIFKNLAINSTDQ